MAISLNGTTGVDTPGLVVDTDTLYIDRVNNRVGIGTSSPTEKLTINGSFAATTKSFLIDHPSKPNMKLQYGSLEGPENGVYVRGRLKGSSQIVLPDYWLDLVDEDSISVQLTPIGLHQHLWVSSSCGNVINIGSDSYVDCYYIVFAERKDVEKLKVEFESCQ